MLTSFPIAAFGLMSGLIADLCFYYVPDSSNITGLNWRLMMASPCIPAMVVICFGFLCPESPRWYMSKGRVANAYESMVQLRFNKVQAARDIFYIYTLLEAEKTGAKFGQNKFKEMFTVPRNLRALMASEIVMFMQQVRKIAPLFSLPPCVSILILSQLNSEHLRISMPKHLPVYLKIN